MPWATSPACTELETQMIDWLVEVLGLPSGFLVVRTRWRSHSGLRVQRDITAVIAAREALPVEVERDRDGTRATWSPTPPHKPIRRLRRGFAWQGSDSTTSVRSKSMPPSRWIRRPWKSYPGRPGRRPSALLRVRTVGTTSSTAMDPDSRDRRDLPAVRAMAACRRRLGRDRGLGAGDALDTRRGRTGRQLRVQSA